MRHGHALLRLRIRARIEHGIVHIQHPRIRVGLGIVLSARNDIRQSRLHGTITRLREAIGCQGTSQSIEKLYLFVHFHASTIGNDHGHIAVQRSMGKYQVPFLDDVSIGDMGIIRVPE